MAISPSLSRLGRTAQPCPLGALWAMILGHAYECPARAMREGGSTGGAKPLAVTCTGAGRAACGTARSAPMFVALLRYATRVQTPATTPSCLPVESPHRSGPLSVSVSVSAETAQVYWTGALVSLHQPFPPNLT
jgi:hypothetical protein